MVATFRAPDTLDHTGVLELQKDQFEELFRKILLISDVANLDGALMVVAREHHHGLQGVESFLRDLHTRLGICHKLHLNNRLYRPKGQSTRSAIFAIREMAPSLL